MNQPDSIQKSRPGLRREALPGSLLCFGFRSPDGQLETTWETGGRPRRSAPGGRRGPPTPPVSAWRVGRKLAPGPLPPFRRPPFLPPPFPPSSGRGGLGRRPAQPGRGLTVQWNARSEKTGTPFRFGIHRGPT